MSESMLPIRLGKIVTQKILPKGPPTIIPIVAAKNIINAFGPSLIISFKSMLIVSNTKLDGNR